MNFSDVIGNELVKNQLRKQVQGRRVSHAQLFHGPAGTGKLPMALAFAKFLLCTGERTHDACGTCPSCKKAEKLIHPDLHFSYPVIKPEGSSKAPPVSTDYIKPFRAAFLENPYLSIQEWLQHLTKDNKQGNITVNECHEIIKKLSLKAYEGEYKVLVMWGAEYLGKEGNILLKLIEEPPQNTVILLLTDDKEKILNTIISRTQQVLFKRLSHQEITEGLERLEEADAAAASVVAPLADGNFNEAKKIFREKADDHVEEFKQWLRLCFNKDVKGLMTWSEEVAKTPRENQKNLLRYGLHLVNEALRAKIIDQYNLKLHESELKMAQFLAEKTEYQQAARLAEVLEEAHYHIERNAFSKLLFLDISIHILNTLHGQKAQVKEVWV